MNKMSLNLKVILGYFKTKKLVTNTVILSFSVMLNNQRNQKGGHDGSPSLTPMLLLLL
jgi:hypothetical protein